jgi:hypothetical protein
MLSGFAHVSPHFLIRDYENKSKLDALRMYLIENETKVEGELLTSFSLVFTCLIFSNFCGS